MDYSQYVLAIIKIDKVRSGLNPIIYYSLKYIYNPEFTKRSPCFSKALKYFYHTMASTFKLNISDINSALNLNKSCSSAIQKQNYNTITSKDNIVKLKDLFSHDIEWFIDNLIKYRDDYILDSQDDFVLLNMIKSYIFSEDVPETSELMLGYNLFSSSIELMFCLRLVLEYPKIFFQRKEEKLFQQYTQSITKRILLFCIEWRKLYPNKYTKSVVIQQLMKNTSNVTSYNTEHIDVNTLTLDEPLLTKKYISLIKLIREGIFVYEIDEIARQMCLIEQEYFCSITKKELIEYIVKKEIPEVFDNLFQREKQLQSYILIFLTLISNVESQRNVVQNFINLAYTCKKMNNFQTCYMIISTFSKININKRPLLWRLISQKYKDIYHCLEQEYCDLDLNEKSFFEQMPKEVYLSVPHISFVRNQINNYIINIKNASEGQKAIISKEIQQFFLRIEMLQRAKYPFFVVNPLNDFLKFGFLEVNKTKQWGIKSRFDFITYSNPNADFGKLLDLLVKFHKKNP